MSNDSEGGRGMNMNELWHSTKEDDWLQGLDLYWRQVSADNRQLEESLEVLDPNDVRQMNVNEFYLFLHDTYFVWKYTAKNRLATTRMHLKKHLFDLTVLEKIQRDLFSFDKLQIHTGLEIATKINGLGISGASGLLAILFPDYFGTVDQFVVKSLCRIDELTERSSLLRMNPESLTLKNGVVLETIMRAKADELNGRFGTNTWTPRKIDKILWGYRE